MAIYTSGMTLTEMLSVRARDSDAPSQEQLAARFGVTQSTVSRWHSGATIPSPERAPALAAYLGTDELDVVQALHLQRTRPSDLEVNATRSLLAHIREEHPDDPEGLRQDLLDLKAAIDQALAGLTETRSDATTERHRRMAQPPTQRQFAQAAHGGETESQSGTVDKPPATGGFDPDDD